MIKPHPKPSLRPYRQLPKHQPLRDAIIDDAVAILTTEGATGFSALKVAKSLGIRQGHLTYHFPSREQLLHALVDRLLSDYAKEFNRVITRTLQGRLRSGEPCRTMNRIWFNTLYFPLTPFDRARDRLS